MSKDRYHAFVFLLIASLFLTTSSSLAQGSIYNSPEFSIPTTDETAISEIDSEWTYIRIPSLVSDKALFSACLSQSPRLVNMDFNCTVTLDNTSNASNGPFDISNVVVEITFPPMFSLVLLVPAPGSTCLITMNVIVCTFPTFAANATADFGLTFQSPQTGFFTLIGEVTAAESDPNILNNQFETLIQIVPPEMYSVHIRKFWDYDSDGNETGKPGINDVTIGLHTSGGMLIQSQTTMDHDENGDEIIDPLTETGWVWFTEVPPGEYILVETVPEGYSSTNPAGASMAINVPMPVETPYIAWGNIGPVDWGDLPDPGAWSPPCAVLGGCYGTLEASNGPRHLITPMPFMLGVSIDGEADGQPSRFADGDGADEDGLVSAVVNPDGSVTLDVRMTDPKNTPRLLDVFIDLNRNGEFNLPEDAVITSFPLKPNDVTTVTTAPLGFDEGELVGYMRLRVSTAGNVSPWGPVGDGEVEDYVDFGIDWGDLPDPRMGTTDPCPAAEECYPTLATSFGPSHAFVSTDPALGFRIDDESDGQPDALALGDDASPTTPFIDYNPGVDTGDENGLVSVSIQPDGSLTLRVRLSDPRGVGALLDVWIDLNDDGYLAYAGDTSTRVPEDVVVAFPLGHGITTVTTGILNPPLLPDEGIGFMRLRISQSGGLSPYGPEPDGEVEDYYLPATDWGDAPEEMNPDFPDIPFGYPTKRANNGAYHLASQASRIGAESDGEPDGQPTILADGDDMTAKDDEDGIEFDGDVLPLSFKFTVGSDEETLVPGFIAGGELNIIVYPSRSGKIDAWMDWNADGDWEDGGENIYSGEMVNPPVDTLTLVIPENAATGFSFARFRFSLNGAQSFDGEADDGEVEDYIYYIPPFEVIDSDGDGGDSNPGDGVCDDGTGKCTLRAAIEESNASRRPRLVTIPGGTGKRLTVIKPTSPFPVITSPFILDGDELLEIDGSLAGAGAHGFVFDVSGSAIVSTLIHSFDGDAIRVTGNDFFLVDSQLSDNGGSGIVVVSGTEVSIRTSAIFDNGGLGIDLGDDGVTLNDIDDTDGGANNLLNYPVLTSVTAENKTINGTFSSIPGQFFVLDFFSSPSCDASGYGEGMVYLGTAMVQTDGGGSTDFTVEATEGPILIGDAITGTATDEAGNTSEFSQCIAAITTDIERINDAEIPADFVLHQNYPNPFNPVTNITFGLSRAEFVTVEVFDILGKKVETLVSEWKEQGEFTVTFDASDLPSGIYLYRMTAGSFSSVRQLTLLK